MAPTPSSFVDFTLDERHKFSPVGLRAFFRLEAPFHLSETETSRLLGGATRSDIKEWKRAATAQESITLPNDTLNRVRGVLVVLNAVMKRYPKSMEKAESWIRTVHRAPIFEGKSPLAMMMDSNPEGLCAAMRYLAIQNTLPDAKKATAKPVRRRKTEGA